MSVAIESRTKRNLSKQITIKNDKIKKKTFGGNSLSYVNNEDIEFDCDYKIKERNYNPEREFCNTVKEENKNYTRNLELDCIPLSIEDTKKKIQSQKTCIIDVRDCRTHQNGHIKNDLLFNCQKRMMMLRSKKSWDMFEDKNFYDSFIIYNQKGEDTPLVQDFIHYIKKDCKNVFFIKGGYEEFFNYAGKELTVSVIPEDMFDQHYYSLTNEATKSTDVLNATISEILPYLYLGNELDSKDLELLKRKKITHILNVTNSVPCSHEGRFVYKRLSATDCNKQNMRAYNDEAFYFIDKARAEGGRVLVHCWAGVSRSATIVAAYLLKHTHLNVLQTIQFLRSKRSIVEPNFNFLGQLERFYCDLENNIETRVLFKNEEEIIKKVVDLERVKDLSLSSESSDCATPLSPSPIKPYFNFKK